MRPTARREHRMKSSFPQRWCDLAGELAQNGYCDRVSGNPLPRDVGGKSNLKPFASKSPGAFLADLSIQQANRSELRNRQEVRQTSIREFRAIDGERVKR